MTDQIRVIETHERTGLQREYEIPAGVPGVAFNPPPTDHVGPIMAAVNSMNLSPGKTGALVGLVNEQGANAAIVIHTPHGFEVQAWISKTWKGSTDYGVSVLKEW